MEKSGWQDTSKHSNSLDLSPIDTSPQSSTPPIPLKKMGSYESAASFSDDSRTFPEENEEGLQLLARPSLHRSAMPTHSHDSTTSLGHDEATEMYIPFAAHPQKNSNSNSNMDPPTQPTHPQTPTDTLVVSWWKQLSSFSWQRTPTADTPRTLYLNRPELNAQCQAVGNAVSTTKYHPLTFLIKFLYEEFSKSANLFFLFISGIQQIPNISPTSRYTTLVPLVIVLFITAVKEIIEDYGVYRSDNALNARACRVFDGTQFVKKQWRDIIVGDICRVENSEFFPADLILLSSSEPEGLCYIETSNLDGEVNLKIKQALPETSKYISPQQLTLLQGTLLSEHPNNRLYNYDGTLSLATEIATETPKDLPLDPTQVLLRGAQLRNTSWVYAVVVFTGHESKLMLNSSKKPSKASNVTRITNRNILYLFAMLVMMSILCSIGNLAISLRYGDQIEYISTPATERAREFGLNILTFMILFNSFIPISLMVTMEIVKFIQATMIDNDLDIYYEKTNTPAVARSSSLIEELGQVEYVFSDKTGTLTCNEMGFRECSIAGLSYATAPDPDRTPASDADSTAHYSYQQLDTHLLASPHRTVIHEFMTALMTCHTVIPETHSETGECVYQASSPDEAALVQGASSVFGYRFYARRPRSIHCTVKGVEAEFQILNVCEFNSTRKRMSVILRGPDGKIKVYCKGADTVILERLKGENPFVEATLEHLEDFASQGLRTLCFAVRTLSEEDYAQWSIIHDKASTTLVHRAEALGEAAELIEKDMQLLGATAIEDKLQDGVPETIHTLQEANIKIWVLTGDRQETAINIGYSCKLLTEDMALVLCNEQDQVSTRKFLENALSDALVHAASPTEEPLALIIEGKALTFALEKDIEKTLFDLATRCKAVICCRVSPLQKALVVKLVKKYSNCILLAIGDGANDVSMIQAAHVGVGISGVEGLQAARSADFAISQFRFLKKLLLVHGSWAYQRLSKMIFFYFYKNVALYLTQFWYAIFNGFSGQTLYESWTMSCFNVIFTFLPPMAIGVFDQFASARLLDKYPQMYMLGQRNEFFNRKRFWGWILNAVYHSVLLFFLGVLAFSNDAVFDNGMVGGQWWVGTTIFSATLATILWKAALISDIWTKYTFIAIPGSMLIWFIFLPLVAYVGPMLPWGIFYEYEGIIPLLLGNVNFWLFFLLVPLMCILRDYLWKYYKRMYRTRSYHYIQEIQKFNLPDYRPRMDRFRQAVNKVRKIQRLKQSRGFAFSQNENDQSKIIRMYDTTQQKPSG
ncbi:hypothetical protein BDF14DRAFT_1814290 [Spinellus fusiger]|nr:hypothetical protein BDF14DRAFT_1814290 [Spinellus fusiger]